MRHPRDDYGNLIVAMRDYAARFPGSLSEARFRGIARWAATFYLNRQMAADDFNQALAPLDLDSFWKKWKDPDSAFETADEWDAEILRATARKPPDDVCYAGDLSGWD